MSIVWSCPLAVDAYALAGREVVVPRPDCPCCDQPMIFWFGYERFVRCGGDWPIWVRRAKCVACAITHALLPAFCLVGRLDSVEVIGAALASAVVGVGDRRAALVAGVAHSTVRGWRRRYRSRCAALAAGFSALAVELGSIAPVYSSDGPRAGLEALGAAWDAARSRFAEVAMGLWRFASVVCSGAVLATTTDSPWAGAGGRRFIPPVP